ncbi:MAG: AMP-binding protein [Frankiales bacterium]|nr:AMP-binding protein [Frankiales bacterium]
MLEAAVLDVVGLRVLARSGLLAPVRPDRLLGMALSVARWGITPATGYAAGAARHPSRAALIDDDGPLTWREVDQRTDRLAAELRARGLRPGDAAGLLTRNGRGLVEAAVALAKVGADVLYLNTGSAGEPLAQVLDREGARAVVHDEEFTALLAPALPGRLALTTELLDGLARTSRLAPPPKPGRTSRQVILTSGTTGAPRGAARGGASVEDAVAILSVLPLRTGETTVLAAPAFHAWGLGHLSLAMLLGSTVVLQRRFDADRVLQAVQQHRATALIVVPVMLERLVEVAGNYDTTSLRVIASSGSALPGDLVARVQEAFGPVLHNLYGSTEVAYAAVASPQDLAADPRTAGRAPHGVTLRVVDERGHDVAPGTAGRIFVGSGLAFAGYTDGSDKDRLDGLVSTGDLGMLSEAGLLTVLGRDDDMVVVGGENVHPGQVEDVLAEDPSVAEVAVVDELDELYGVRLVAPVVAAPGATVDAEHLQQLVRDRLARFAVPREIRLLDELPRNATGKVLRRELRR